MSPKILFQVTRNVDFCRLKCYDVQQHQTSLPHIHRARFISSKIKDDMYYIYLACFISSRLKERDVLPLPDLPGSSNGGAKKEDIQIYETRVQALLPIFPPPPHTPANPRRACL